MQEWFNIDKEIDSIYENTEMDEYYPNDAEAFEHNKTNASDFKNCHLAGVVFDKREMQHGDFRRANLTKSSFRSVNFHMANFIGANLTGADFGYADLTGADLRGALTDSANFRMSIIDLATKLPFSINEAFRRGCILSNPDHYQKAA